MMLRELADLELGALAITLHELQSVAANQGALQLFQLLEVALAGVTRELLARRRGVPATERFMPAGLAVTPELFAQLGHFMRHGAERLQDLGFAAAATFLEERLPSEICIDVADAHARAGVELRTLN